MTKSTVKTSTESSVDLAEAPIRVLHVDDDAAFLSSTSQILELCGVFQVDTALSIDEVMDKLKKKKYDAIVSDYQMPGKSGLDLLKELRASGNDIPFIIFTGKGREEIAMEALNRGADGYFNKMGDPETVYGELAHGLHQVVEKRKAEDALKESEAKYRSFFENAKDAAITLDLKGNITAINKAVEEYGFQRNEIIGKNMRNFVSRRYWPKLLKDIIQLSRRKTVEDKIEIETPMGKRAIEYRSAPITVEDKVVGIQGILKDVSEREKIEETLKESEENYRNIVELAPDSIMTFDRKGVITSCNEASMRLSGYSKDELLGKHFSKIGLLRVRDIPRYLKMLPSTIRGKIPKPFEVVYSRKDGSEAFGEVRMSLMKEENKIVGIQAIMRDITERKKAEEAIEDLARFPSENPNPVLRIAKDGLILYANAAAKSLLTEWKLEVGQSAPEEWSRKVSTSFVSGSSLLFEVEYLDRVFSFEVSPVTDGGYVNAYGRDITERKKSETALRESEERYRSLFESTREGIIITGSEGEILRMNEVAAVILGYDSPEELVRVSAVELYVDPEDRELMFREILEKGFVEHYELTIKKRDGSPIHIIGSNISPKDEEGNILQTEGFFIDITERKKTLRKLETLNEKLEVVGGLTRHDVNNKLATIRSNVYLAKQGLTSDHEALKYLREIESAVEQTTNIFDAARVYERLGTEKLDYIRVEDSVEEAYKQFSDMKVKVVNDFGGLRVLADSLLNRLFYNLIDNSLKHGKKVSKIRVYYEEAKDKLRLVYEDDGFGIPAKEKEKIFEQGYGKGSGIGLYLLMKMCEVYGWTIKETGKLDKGVRFIMTLPKVNADEGKIGYHIKK